MINVCHLWCKHQYVSGADCEILLQGKSRTLASGRSVTTNLPGKILLIPMRGWSWFLHLKWSARFPNCLKILQFLKKNTIFYNFYMFAQVWRANTPLSKAHGCEAVQMQSVWAQFCAQRPSCLAHEETLTKAHEELSGEVYETSQRKSTNKQRWKKFKCDTIFFWRPRMAA